MSFILNVRNTVHTVCKFLLQRNYAPVINSELVDRQMQSGVWVSS